MKLYNLPLLETSYLNSVIYKFTVQSEELANISRPGQFIHIDCGSGSTLRRPVSLYDIDIAQSRISFIFQVRGKGTALLAKKRAGDLLSFIAPLGNGFNVNPTVQNLLVIGGGIGIFPLYALLKNNTKAYKTAILGFPAIDKIVCEPDFAAVCNKLNICTDDGSYGYHGNAAAALLAYMSSVKTANKPELICACGPQLMLKSITAIAAERGIPCQVSLEERMACGIGACLVCACKTRPQNTKTAWNYSHVCSDGPVFDANAVVWD